MSAARLRSERIDGQLRSNLLRLRRISPVFELPDRIDCGGSEEKRRFVERLVDDDDVSAGERRFGGQRQDQRTVAEKVRGG